MHLSLMGNDDGVRKEGRARDAGLGELTDEERPSRGTSEGWREEMVRKQNMQKGSSKDLRKAVILNLEQKYMRSF